MTDKETDKKISQLQTMEQSYQNVMQQKQVFQSQKFEIDNALRELEDLKGDAYKIIGNVMLKRTREDLQKDLDERKQSASVRLSAAEKQEKQIKEKIESLQKEIVEEMKK